MDKKLVVDLFGQLKTVAALKWIDIDFGQLNTPERPAVAFPCALIDVAYPACEDSDGNLQLVTATITLRVAFNDFTGRTGADSPTLNDTLSLFDTLNVIHCAMQSWTDAGYINPLSRQNAQVEKRNDGIKVYRIVYQTTFAEEP